MVLKKEENKYLSKKNAFEYQEIKKLMSVIVKKEHYEIIEDQDAEIIKDKKY